MDGCLDNINVRGGSPVHVKISNLVYNTVGLVGSHFQSVNSIIQLSPLRNRIQTVEPNESSLKYLLSEYLGYMKFSQFLENRLLNPSLFCFLIPDWKVCTVCASYCVCRNVRAFQPWPHSWQ